MIVLSKLSNISAHEKIPISTNIKQQTLLKLSLMKLCLRSIKEAEIICRLTIAFNVLNSCHNVILLNLCKNDRKFHRECQRVLNYVRSDN